MTDINRKAIEDHCRYISDDGMIAAYHQVPRGIVVMIRAELRSPKRDYPDASLNQRASFHGREVYVAPHQDLGDGEYRHRKADAEIANEAHVRALLWYGTKHGLPNISADECARRLEA